MKSSSLIIGLIIAAAVGLMIFFSNTPKTSLPTGGGDNRNISGFPENPAAAINESATITARLDADGCAVVDLRNVPATSHDSAKRVYTWIVEHPADATCVRQFNPSIPEPVKESRSEKIRGTNSWRFEFFY